MFIDIELLESTAKDKTQMDLARILTFDFNPALVSLACSHWGSQDFEQLLRTIIENKTLLKNKIEPIRVFFERVALKSSAVMSTSALESVRPYVKNGVHLAVSKTFLSTSGEYVSVNEANYCVRVGTWWMNTENPKFADVINSNLEELMLVVDDTFNLGTLAKKKDVSVVKSEHLILKDGRVFSVRVVS